MIEMKGTTGTNNPEIVLFTILLPSHCPVRSVSFPEKREVCEFSSVFLSYSIKKKHKHRGLWSACVLNLVQYPFAAPSRRKKYRGLWSACVLNLVQYPIATASRRNKHR
jgi:hypothetical protein